MCDGIKQCPQQDDELLCHLVCPSVCHCQGLAFRCYHAFNISAYPDLRYIDGSDSNFPLSLLERHKLVVHIRLENCSITDSSLAHVPNLRTLNLKSNKISMVDISSYLTLKNLKALILAQNPISDIFCSGISRRSMVSIKTLDISNCMLGHVGKDFFTCSSRLQFLNISDNPIRYISNESFNSLLNLKVLDMGKVSADFYSQGLFANMKFLELIYQISEHTVRFYPLCATDVQKNPKLTAEI